MPLTLEALKQISLQPTSETSKHRVAQYVNEQISLQKKQHRDAGGGREQADVDGRQCTDRDNAGPRFAAADHRRHHGSALTMPKPPLPRSGLPIPNRERILRASPDSSIIPYGIAEREASPLPVPSIRSPSPRPDPGHDPFARRARHKMRESSQENKRPTLPPPVEKTKKKRKALGANDTNARPAKKLTLKKLSRENEGRPVVKNTRLTLNPEHKIGLFKRGRASDAVNTSHALPDLSFSEMTFLQKSTRKAQAAIVHSKKEKAEARHPHPPRKESTAEPSHRRFRPAEPQNWLTNTRSVHEDSHTAYDRTAADDMGGDGSSLNEGGSGRFISDTWDLPKGGDLRDARYSPDAQSLRSMQQEEDLISDGHSVYSIAMRAQSKSRPPRDRDEHLQPYLPQGQYSLRSMSPPSGQPQRPPEYQEADNTYGDTELRGNYVDTAAQHSDEIQEGEPPSRKESTIPQTRKPMLKHKTSHIPHPQDESPEMLEISSPNPRPLKSSPQIDITQLIDACASSADSPATKKQKQRWNRPGDVNSDEIQVEQMLQELTSSNLRPGPGRAGDIYQPPQQFSGNDYEWNERPASSYDLDPATEMGFERTISREYHQPAYNPAYEPAPQNPSPWPAPRDPDPGYGYHGDTQMPWAWEDSRYQMPYDPPGPAYVPVHYDETMRRDRNETSANTNAYLYYRDMDGR